MIFQETKDNIVRVLYTFGALTGTQIKKFFADEVPPARTQELLNSLKAYHQVIYDRDRDRYRYHTEKRVVPEIEQRKIDAFWILTEIGSKNVMDLLDLRYPTQVMFWNNENQAFDITIVQDIREAALAAQVRALRAVQGVADTVTHIAVIPDEELAAHIRPFGFEVFCMIQPREGTVRYLDVQAEFLRTGSKGTQN